MRLAGGYGVKTQPIAGPQLSDFPPVTQGNGRRADEATEAWSIGAQDYRHVAGKVDGADGVGIVVDVRRMQPGLAAVVPGPLRPGADQPYPGAA